MRILRIKANSDAVQTILPVNDETYKDLDFRGESVFSSWKPIEFYVFNPLENRANFFHVGSESGYFAMDETAARELSVFWGLSGELLPSTLEDGTLIYLLNVTEAVNMLNEKQSSFDYYKDGTRGRLLTPVFYNNRLTESSIFKIPQNVKTHILTYKDVKGQSDEFYYAYNESGLTGLIFEEIYTDDLS